MGDEEVESHAVKPFVDKIIELCKKDDGMKLTVISSHDSCIVSLLHYLRCEKLKEWPAYASHVEINVDEEEWEIIYKNKKVGGGKGVLSP